MADGGEQENKTPPNLRTISFLDVELLCQWLRSESFNDLSLQGVNQGTDSSYKEIEKNRCDSTCQTDDDQSFQLNIKPIFEEIEGEDVDF